jgi:hypothetical protein
MMEIVQEIIAGIKQAQELVIEVTTFLALVLFCLLYIWQHLCEFTQRNRESSKRKLDREDPDV